MKKVLICGHRSFVATGLSKEFEDLGVTYDCFSRGEEKREGNVVTGNVMKMAENLLKYEFDAVVYLVYMKGGISNEC